MGPKPILAKGVEVPAVNKALDALRQHIEHEVQGSKVMIYGDKVEKIPVLPSGSLALDVAVGVGGYPYGRVIEVFGMESSGKTTLTLHAIASAQKRGGTALFIDAEHALDVTYAKALGVDTRALLISQPDTGEQALQIALTGISAMKAGDIVVVDSVAGLVPKAELEGDVGDAHVGLQSRLMSQSLRMLVGKVHSVGAVLYFTNQLRDMIGTVSFGPKKTTPGGNALKFYASLRISVTRVGTNKVGEDDNVRAVSNKVEIKVVKNKVAPPFTVEQTTIRFGQGISRADELLEYGVRSGVLTKSGSWYSFGDSRIGQGQEACYHTLLKHPEWMDAIEKQIRERMMLGGGG